MAPSPETLAGLVRSAQDGTCPLLVLCDAFDEAGIPVRFYAIRKKKPYPLMTLREALDLEQTAGKEMFDRFILLLQLGEMLRLKRADEPMATPWYG